MKKIVAVFVMLAICCSASAEENWTRKAELESQLNQAKAKRGLFRQIFIEDCLKSATEASALGERRLARDFLGLAENPDQVQIPPQKRQTQKKFWRGFGIVLILGGAGVISLALAN